MRIYALGYHITRDKNTVEKPYDDVDLPTDRTGDYSGRKENYHPACTIIHHKILFPCGIWLNWVYIFAMRCKYY